MMAETSIFQRGLFGMRAKGLSVGRNLRERGMEKVVIHGYLGTFAWKYCCGMSEVRYGVL